MFYAKINDGNVERYPYTVTDLRRETPNVSFPASMTDAELAPFNVFPVTPTTPPQIDYTKNLARWAEKQGSNWVETWTVSDATPEEIAQRLDSQWQSVRNERDSKLQACDWTQLPDVPLTEEQKQEWVIYRQALRDVTNQPDPFKIVWPVAPQA